MTTAVMERTLRITSNVKYTKMEGSSSNKSASKKGVFNPQKRRPSKYNCGSIIKFSNEDGNYHFFSNLSHRHSTT